MLRHNRLLFKAWIHDPCTVGAPLGDGIGAVVESELEAPPGDNNFQCLQAELPEDEAGAAAGDHNNFEGVEAELPEDEAPASDSGAITTT